MNPAALPRVEVADRERLPGRVQGIGATMANGNGNGNGRRKSRKRLIFVSAGLVLLAVFGLMAARRGGKEIDPSRLAAIEKGDLARSVVATGKVQPLTKVEIKSKASGLVKRLFVDYGDRVKEGQVLAELDREQLEARRPGGEGQPARRRGVLGAEQDRGGGPRPALPEDRPGAGPQALRRRPHRPLPPRGRGQGLPDGPQQADGGEEPGRGQQGRGREGPGRPRAVPRPTCATPRSRAPWTGSSSPATSRWATRSAPSSSSARRRRSS